jgi:hypothetical protein
MNDQTRPPAIGTSSVRPAGDDSNIVDLVGRLTQQGAHLARAQVSLMQAEVREAANDVKAAVAAMASAAVFGIAGLGVLLMGIAYYVGDALDDVPLGTTLTGAATLILAAILYFVGRNKVDGTNLKPDRSLDTLSDTPTAITGDLPHSGGR